MYGENCKYNQVACEAKCLLLKSERMLHEGPFVPVLMYRNVTVVWRERERSRNESVKMNYLRGLLGTGRIDGILKHCRVVWVEKRCE